MKDRSITPRGLLFSGLAASLLATAAPAATPEPAEDRMRVQEGIAVAVDLEPVDREAGAELRQGDTVTFRFAITDTNTDTPLSGVYPAAWMDRRVGDEADRQAACQEKVQAFIGGSLFAPPELDLNVYHVLALNDDPTISVVDPLFGFGTTKLLDMIFLQSPGEDWALSADQMTLYVSMPEANQVAVASTATWEVEHDLTVGQNPSRVELQADGRYLWVGFDGLPDSLSGVSVIDTEQPAVVKNILTGRGHHEIALSSDDRWAFVTNQADGSLSIIDVATLEIVDTVEVGREPVSLDYSPLADAVFVANRGDGTLVTVDAGRRRVIARERAAAGVTQVRLAPGGHLAIAVNPETDEVYILDAATSRIVQTADVEDGPDQVAFSDHLAYIRHRGSETVLMIPLDQIGREGSPVPVIDFPGGHAPFGRGARPSPADGIVQAPGATAVLVANPADKTIYFYKEGMAAPMGNFQNYNRQPRAVLAVDRSLEERAPGVYETTATLRRPGRYDLAFFLDSPRTIHCFDVEVAPGVERKAPTGRLRPVSVEPSIAGRALAYGDRVDLPVGQPVTIDFKLFDAATGEPREGLRDVRVLTFRAPGRDQRRRLARPLGGGVYRIELLPAQAGVYYAYVESAAAGLKLNESTQLILVVRDAPLPRRATR